MGFQALIKFALICLDDLAWPLLALGYPLRASILAIETNSNSDTKKLVAYWVIFSLISLFEHAFMGMLQWLLFWPYMKLTIVCWMMIPDFDGAFYVYNHFVQPCLGVDMETIFDLFNKFQEFVFKDSFLVETNRCVMMAHGPEASEKPLSTELSKGMNSRISEKPLATEVSKGMNSSILQSDLKALQETEKREVVSAVNLTPEIEPLSAKTINDAIAVQEVKEGAGFGHPEIPSDKQQVQKEWACAMCQVTTSSEITLNSHLQGRRHRETYEELMKAKNQLSKGKVSHASVVKAKHSDISNQKPSGNATAASQKKQQQPPSTSSVAMNAHLPSKAVNPKTGQQKVGILGKKPQFRCTVCNIYCGRAEDLNSHLWGKKHLARIQELIGPGTS